MAEFSTELDPALAAIVAARDLDSNLAPAKFVQGGDRTKAYVREVIFQSLHAMADNALNFGSTAKGNIIHQLDENGAQILRDVIASLRAENPVSREII